jgi:hypothetical protein
LIPEVDNEISTGASTRSISSGDGLRHVVPFGVKRLLFIYGAVGFAALSAFCAFLTIAGAAPERYVVVLAQSICFGILSILCLITHVWRNGLVYLGAAFLAFCVSLWSIADSFQRLAHLATLSVAEQNDK